MSWPPVQPTFAQPPWRSATIWSFICSKCFYCSSRSLHRSVPFSGFQVQGEASAVSLRVFSRPNADSASVCRPSSCVCCLTPPRTPCHIGRRPIPSPAQSTLHPGRNHGCRMPYPVHDEFLADLDRHQHRLSVQYVLFHILQQIVSAVRNERNVLRAGFPEILQNDIRTAGIRHISRECAVVDRHMPRKSIDYRGKYLLKRNIPPVFFHQCISVRESPYALLEMESTAHSSSFPRRAPNSNLY